jgi:hypothetical protein
VDYETQSALFQWEEGERRSRELGLDRAKAAVVDELRRRLGSSFRLGELVRLYASSTDWAVDLAWQFAGTEASWAVDAAFLQYAREANDYGGGYLRDDG